MHWAQKAKKLGILYFQRDSPKASWWGESDRKSSNGASARYLNKHIQYMI